MATFDQVGFFMIQSSYQNLWKSVAAGGVTWLSKPLLNRLGFNVPHTITFVATASLIYYTSSLFFNVSDKSRNLIPLFLNRAASLIVLTKVIADQQKLDIPFVQTYAKTAACACIVIGAIEWLSQFIKTLKKSKNTLPFNILQTNQTRYTQRPSTGRDQKRHVSGGDPEDDN